MTNEAEGPSPEEMGLTVENPETDAEVVRKIVEAVVVEQSEKNPAAKQYTLLYGRKELFLTYSRLDKKVSGYIQNIESQESHKDRETTLLYLAARDLVKKIADETGKPLIYTLQTSNPKLIDWAQTKGKEIFNWDESKIFKRMPREPDYYIFESPPLKTVEPEK